MNRRNKLIEYDFDDRKNDDDDDDDANSMFVESDDSSSVFNSENEKPISSSSSNQSLERDDLLKKLRVQSAMQDEGPANWQLQKQSHAVAD